MAEATNTAPAGEGASDWAYEAAKDIRLKWMQTAFMRGSDIALPAGHLTDIAEALRLAHTTGQIAGEKAVRASAEMALMYLKSGFLTCSRCGNEEPTEHLDAAYELQSGLTGKLVASTGSRKEETKGATPMGSGHSRVEPSGLKASPECPSRGWQPIATAPKDGTDVLLYAAAWDWTWGVQMGRFEQGQWFTGEGSVDENDAGFDPDAEVDEDVDPDELKNFGPTHWMPIPEPPASCDRSPKGEDAEGGFVHEGAVAEGQTP
ncbi:DUF551 domain-containing protein [Methylobacterium sp. NMS14P]|uniref:DUF551 domain-containing protein n=1 Tax=Methylobacterium sp. NMS14P TaxID=2894310 RepID=UPI0023583B9F|nr:DUF551 domain-containing protein [Methylobacterium sp. NMS14P]WCS27286.1 DUF551 domain-containing protein [Methylobacterium sp. NMS14P]